MQGKCIATWLTSCPQWCQQGQNCLYHLVCKRCFYYEYQNEHDQICHRYLIHSNTSADNWCGEFKPQSDFNNAKDQLPPIEASKTE